jgi:hypothetical protein
MTPPHKSHNKTAKKRRESKKHELPEHAVTMHGVNHWFVYVFEKLGWMLLAKAKGHDYKITTYKKSIKHLIESIEHLMTEYSDADRKHDLNVLLMETHILDKYVNKHL